jgi:hypothetical protein
VVKTTACGSDAEPRPCGGSSWRAKRRSLQSESRSTMATAHVRSDKSDMARSIEISLST